MSEYSLLVHLRFVKKWVNLEELGGVSFFSPNGSNWGEDLTKKSLLS